RPLASNLSYRTHWGGVRRSRRIESKRRAGSAGKAAPSLLRSPATIARRAHSSLAPSGVWAGGGDDGSMSRHSATTDDKTRRRRGRMGKMRQKGSPKYTRRQGKPNVSDSVW